MNASDKQDDARYYPRPYIARELSPALGWDWEYVGHEDHPEGVRSITGHMMYICHRVRDRRTGVEKLVGGGELRRYCGIAPPDGRAAQERPRPAETLDPGPAAAEAQDVLLSGDELDRIEHIAEAILQRIDTEARRGLDSTSTDQRFQWAILKVVAGDTESVYRLLRGTSHADDPRFPATPLRAVLNLAI